MLRLYDFIGPAPQQIRPASFDEALFPAQQPLRGDCQFVRNSLRALALQQPKNALHLYVDGDRLVEVDMRGGWCAHAVYFMLCAARIAWLGIVLGNRET